MMNNDGAENKGSDENNIQITGTKHFSDIPCVQNECGHHKRSTIILANVDDVNVRYDDDDVIVIFDTND